MTKLIPGGLLLLSLIPGAVAAQGRSSTPSRKPSVPGIETYESAAIDTNGSVRITTSDHKEVVVPRGELADGSATQMSFTEPILSPNRTAVGSQAMYGNCCTSYDIPLELVIYAQGRVHRFRGIDLPIFQWHFADAGTRVAYSQEPVHFSCSTHYELREIRSERLIDSVDLPGECGGPQDRRNVKIPKWVMDLNAPRERQ